jgi:hypothetical protein
MSRRVVAAAAQAAVSSGGPPSAGAPCPASTGAGAEEGESGRIDVILSGAPAEMANYGYPSYKWVGHHHFQ